MGTLGVAGSGQLREGEEGAGFIVLQSCERDGIPDRGVVQRAKSEAAVHSNDLRFKDSRCMRWVLVLELVKPVPVSWGRIRLR